MKLYPEQLDGHLRGALQPIYVIAGDEPLQMQEAADAIRAAARAQGYTERQLLHAEAGFDWNGLHAAGGALSLFAERKLIDLRLPGGKPGDAGGKALAAYAERPPEETILLVTSAKLDKKAQGTKWFKALEAAGAFLAVWPIEPKALPGWITRRLKARGLEASPEAVRLLAQRVEGNMLAAAQEVEKLLLLYGPGALDADKVATGVADSARFDLFELVDTALAGDAVRTVRVLDGLRGEGQEPILVLWAFAREIRALAAMAAAVERGTPLPQVLTAHRVWDKRKAPITAALGRHRTAARWERLLVQAGRIDRMVKGAEPGSPWDELLQLAAAVAGVRVI